MLMNQESKKERARRINEEGRLRQEAKRARIKQQEQDAADRRFKNAVQRIEVKKEKQEPLIDIGVVTWQDALNRNRLK